MYNDCHWCEMFAYEKIAAARRSAAHDRLAVAAVQAKRGAGQGAPSRYVGLLRVLANALGHGRPVLERKIPTGQAQ